MLKNYLKIAWRNLVKGKIYAGINIAGLAVGIACCLLIGLYVYEQLRYDHFHKKSEQLYRVVNVLTAETQGMKYAKTPKPLAPYLENRIPEVKRAVRIMEASGVVRIDNRMFEQQFLVAEEGFLQIFSFPLLKGHKATALQQRDEILLTQSAARKFFGSTDVIGKRIELRINGEYYPATVGGILKDPPQYSSIQFEVIIPLTFWTKVNPEGFASGNNWNTLSPVTYVLLQKKTNPTALAKMVEKTIEAELPKSVTEYQKYIFQPITEIHFDASVQGGLVPTANIAFVYISIALAILILLIACINFMSISIGRSARRAREVGMRKAVGAFRRQVMAQFWSETMMVILFSLILGLILTNLLTPYLSALLGQPLAFNLLTNPVLLILVAGTVVLTGLLAGSYPAVYLSKFEPSQVFRNSVSVKGNQQLIRSLTGIQFALATFLIIGALFMNQQMELLRNKSLGFNKEFVIQVELPFRESKEIIKDLRVSLTSEPGVKHIAGVWQTFAPGGVKFDLWKIKSGDRTIMGYVFGAGPRLKETLKLEIVKGRDIRRNSGGDSTQQVLVNQELVEAFGWEHPIGKTVSRSFIFQNAEIVGVVKNFHFQSLHYPIGPLAIYSTPHYTAAYIRITPPVSKSLDQVRAAWEKAVPGLPFDYTFLEEAIEQQYRSDKRWTRIVQSASAVAIFLACMGLFGLALLASQRRSKEISIRKVLGASTTEVATMLSKDFLKPVVVALFAAIPAAYMVMQFWLQNFAYKINLGITTFIIAVVLTLLIALATVSWQSIRAATANPVDSLRSE